MLITNRTINHEKMSKRKMSREEHDETVASISTGVAYIIKMGKILIPIFVAMVGAIIWIGLKAISLNDWQQSLVKRPEFNREVISRVKADSTLNAKIDTAIKPMYSNYTQHRDKNGNITYRKI